MKKVHTFANELIREQFLNSRSSLVISFSVINYVVSETSPRERRSLILFIRVMKKPSCPSQGMTEWILTHNPNIIDIPIY